MALIDYSESGVTPELDGISMMAFSFIQSQMDRDSKKYENRCSSNRENGKKGGRPKKENDSEENPKNPMGFEETEKKTKNPKKPIKIKNKDKEKDKDSNVIAYDRTCNTYWKIKCRYIPTFYPGTGDAYTSVMIGSLLDGDSLPIALDKGVQFITQAIKASYGFDYPNREGVLLERVLEVLKMPVVLGGYEMI